MVRTSKAYVQSGTQVAIVFSNSVDFGIGRRLEGSLDFEVSKTERSCLVDDKRN